MRNQTMMTREGSPRRAADDAHSRLIACTCAVAIVAVGLQYYVCTRMLQLLAMSIVAHRLNIDHSFGSTHDVH